MPDIDESYIPRPWKCEECGSILGYVIRFSDRVRRLYVLRYQVPPKGKILPAQEVFAAVRMVRHTRMHIWRVRGVEAAQGVGCDRCSCIQEWRPSEESILHLIEKTFGLKGVDAYDKLRLLNK